MIGHVKQAGYGLVSLEEVVEVIGRGRTDKPVAVFTLDDGYRDNFIHAWPVFRTHRCPFTIFVAPAITDGTSELWWKALEHVIAWNDTVDPGDLMPGSVISLKSDRDRRVAFRRLYRALRALEPHRQTRAIRALAAAHGVDTGFLCRSLAMDWNEIRSIAADPLCSIGAHTVHHFALARLDAEEALKEAQSSRDRIAAEVGRAPISFAYPYGDALSCGPRDFALIADAGFTVAVTTRKGLLAPRHATALDGASAPVAQRFLPEAPPCRDAAVRSAVQLGAPRDIHRMMAIAPGSQSRPRAMKPASSSQCGWPTRRLPPIAMANRL